MAAGRYLNYRDNELNEGKENFGVKREIGYNKEGVFDRVRNDDRGRIVDWGSGSGGDNELNNGKDNFRVKREIGYDKEGLFDRLRNDDRGRIVNRGSGSGVVGGRIRQKDVKERAVVVNGRGLSDSGTSGGGDRRNRCGFIGGSVDREPGELSSESGSDGGMESESRVKDAESMNETKRIENGTQNNVVESRKRKFSPIIWDMDDKESRKGLKSTKSPAISSQPPLPPIPKSCGMPNLVTDVDVHISASPSKISKLQVEEASPGNPYVELDEDVTVAVNSPVEQTPAREEVKVVNSYLEADTGEDEESIPVLNIRSSRWANDADSPTDEGELPEDENPKIKKRRSIHDSVEIRGHRKSVTPNVRDLMRKSSESDEQF
ncbi:hypothetical protein Leryth_010820 [Lithospermum erythrorhizon]|nr:hypothetical protein Leryth_010820 [Lithospermum erythrorhizon]